MKKINDIFGFVEKYYSILIQYYRYTISYQNVQKQELPHGIKYLYNNKIVKYMDLLITCIKNSLYCLSKALFK